MIIQLGTEQDIDHWMNLVEKVRDSFPGLETEEALNEHRNIVLDFMNRNSAICAKEKGKIVGILLFSNENSELCFLAVAAEYRRRHIAEKCCLICSRNWIPQKTYLLRLIVTVCRKELLREHSISVWGLSRES